MSRFRLFLPFLLLISCAKEPEPIRDGEWLIVPPQSVDLNGAELLEARERAEGIDRLRSLLVIKDGHIVLEYYRLFEDKNSRLDVRSVTKSIIGTLALIAQDQGYISSLEDPIGNYLPDSLGLSPIQQAIQVNHLLSMQSGFDWYENGSQGYAEWINAQDQLQYLLARPLVSTPGTRFVYNSAAVHLLGVVIEHAAGMELEAFAETYLFSPMNIDRVDWEYITGPYPNAGSGLDLTTRDLAKLGILYLQEGSFDNRRLLSANLIGEAIKPQVSLPGTSGVITDFSYGYLWWVIHAPVPAFMAQGYGGQYLVGFPAWNMVVVATTDYRSLGADESTLSQTVSSLIFNDVLDAVE